MAGLQEHSFNGWPDSYAKHQKEKHSEFPPGNLISVPHQLEGDKHPLFMISEPNSLSLDETFGPL